MAKDKQARRENSVTVMALANLIATIVDTMRDSDLPNDVIHAFLDKLERINALTLYGAAGEIMEGIVEVVRRTVPDND